MKKSWKKNLLTSPHLITGLVQCGWYRWYCDMESLLKVWSPESGFEHHWNHYRKQKTQLQLIWHLFLCVQERKPFPSRWYYNMFTAHWSVYWLPNVAVLSDQFIQSHTQLSFSRRIIVAMSGMASVLSECYPSSCSLQHSRASHWAHSPVQSSTCFFLGVFFRTPRLCHDLALGRFQ